MLPESSLKYFGSTFHMPWSDDHLKVIRKIEKAVIEGGLFAMAMPRGSSYNQILCSICKGEGGVPY